MNPLETLFSSNFMPHGMCYAWQPGLLWMHVVSDSLIFLSHMVIPMTLVYIIRQRSDLIFSKVMVLFGLFVLFCGITHGIAIWTVWNGSYWFSGSVKSITAIISVATAVMLWRLVPTLKNITTVEKLQIEVNARKAVEAELLVKAKLLEQTTAELQHSNRELQNFASSASHDLKSPINAISHLVRWIEDDIVESGTQLSEETKRNFQLMNSRLSRMNNLLDGLMEFARVGHIETKLGAINCEEYFTEIFDLLNTRQEVKLHLAPDLPTFDTLVAPFTQVIRNLLDNAIKHHQPGEANIWISATRQGDNYEFLIRDDGAGVSEVDMPKMVNMFVTLKPKDKVEGSGIGLALISKIIQIVGGYMRFESLPGEGLSVYLLWPANMDIESNKAITIDPVAVFDPAPA